MVKELLQSQHVSVLHYKKLKYSKHIINGLIDWSLVLLLFSIYIHHMYIHHPIYFYCLMWQQKYSIANILVLIGTQINKYSFFCILQ